MCINNEVRRTSWSYNWRKWDRDLFSGLYEKVVDSIAVCFGLSEQWFLTLPIINNYLIILILCIYAHSNSWINNDLKHMQLENWRNWNNILVGRYKAVRSVVAVIVLVEISSMSFDEINNIYLLFIYSLKQWQRGLTELK